MAADVSLALPDLLLVLVWGCSIFSWSAGWNAIGITAFVLVLAVATSPRCLIEVLASLVLMITSRLHRAILRLLVLILHHNKHLDGRLDIVKHREGLTLHEPPPFFLDIFLRDAIEVSHFEFQIHVDDSTMNPFLIGQSLWSSLLQRQRTDVARWPPCELEDGCWWHRAIQFIFQFIRDSFEVLAIIFNIYSQVFWEARLLLRRCLFVLMVWHLYEYSRYFQIDEIIYKNSEIK